MRHFYISKELRRICIYMALKGQPPKRPYKLTPPHSVHVASKSQYKTVQNRTVEKAHNTVIFYPVNIPYISVQYCDRAHCDTLKMLKTSIRALTYTKVATSSTDWRVNMQPYCSIVYLLWNMQRTTIMCIRNCWTEMLAQSLGHIIILVHFRSKR
jgi:hypothetical protein